MHFSIITAPLFLNNESLKGTFKTSVVTTRNNMGHQINWGLTSSKSAYSLATFLWPQLKDILTHSLCAFIQCESVVNIWSISVLVKDNLWLCKQKVVTCWTLLGHPAFRDTEIPEFTCSFRQFVDTWQTSHTGILQETSNNIYCINWSHAIWHIGHLCDI